MKNISQAGAPREHDIEIGMKSIHISVKVTVGNPPEQEYYKKLFGEGLNVTQGTQRQKALPSASQADVWMSTTTNT